MRAVDYGNIVAEGGVYQDVIDSVGMDVQKMIEKGFVPAGSIQVVYVGIGLGWLAVQTMVKYEPEVG